MTRTFDRLLIGQFTIRVTYTYGQDGEKTGYAYSEENAIVVSTLGGLDCVVQGGRLAKAYSGDMQVYNLTTSDYRSHRGIDIVTTGSDWRVYAVFSGRITEVSGSRVVLSSYDGTMKICYNSLSNIEVTAGDTVLAGQTLGMLGKTLLYEKAEEAHVHLELYVDGEEKDPMKYFQ